jgi:hypothetical protein
MGRFCIIILARAKHFFPLEEKLPPAFHAPQAGNESKEQKGKPPGSFYKNDQLKVCIYMHKKDNKHKDDYIYSKESIFEKHNKLQRYKYLPELSKT